MQCAAAAAAATTRTRTVAAQEDFTLARVTVIRTSGHKNKTSLSLFSLKLLN